MNITYKLSSIFCLSVLNGEKYFNSFTLPLFLLLFHLSPINIKTTYLFHQIYECTQDQAQGLSHIKDCKGLRYKQIHGKPGVQCGNLKYSFFVAVLLCFLDHIQHGHILQVTTGLHLVGLGTLWGAENPTRVGYKQAKYCTPILSLQPIFCFLSLPPLHSFILSTSS